MTDITPSPYKGILRMFIYSGVPLVSLTALGIFPVRESIHLILGFCALVIGSGAVLSLYRFSREPGDRQLASERFAAMLSIGVLSLTAIVVHMEHFFEPPKPSSSFSISPPLQEAVETQKASSEIKNDDKETPKDGPQMPPEMGQRVDRMLAEADKARKEGKTDAADALLLEAIELIDTLAPKDLPQRGQIVGTLAQLRFQAKRPVEGVDAIDQHLEKLRHQENGDPALVASFQELAGRLLGESGLYAEALDRFREVFEIQTRIKAAPSAIANTRISLAISHARMNDKSSAKQELDLGRELLRTASPGDPEVMGRLERIAKEYEL